MGGRTLGTLEHYWRTHLPPMICEIRLAEEDDEDGKHYYEVGQDIRGELFINASKPIHASAIKVALEGTAGITVDANYDTFSKRLLGRLRGQGGRRSNLIQKTEMFLDVGEMVLGSREDDDEEQVIGGSVSFPFSIRIPAVDGSLLGSMNNCKGSWVQYAIVPYIQAPYQVGEWKELLVPTKTVTIQAYFSLSAQAPSLLTPVTYEKAHSIGVISKRPSSLALTNTTSSSAAPSLAEVSSLLLLSVTNRSRCRCSTCGETPFRVIFRLPKSGFLVGESVPFQAFVFNPQALSVGRGSVRLVQAWIYGNHNHVDDDQEDAAEFSILASTEMEGSRFQKVFKRWEGEVVIPDCRPEVSSNNKSVRKFKFRSEKRGGVQVVKSNQDKQTNNPPTVHPTQRGIIAVHHYLQVSFTFKEEEDEPYVLEVPLEIGTHP